MPIIGNEHQISISVAHTTTWNVPRNLNSNLAKQNHALHDLLPTSPIYVILTVPEKRGINEHKVDSINKCMEIVHF